MSPQGLVLSTSAPAALGLALLALAARRSSPRPQSQCRRPRAPAQARGPRPPSTSARPARARRGPTRTRAARVRACRARVAASAGRAQRVQLRAAGGVGSAPGNKGSGCNTVRLGSTMRRTRMNATERYSVNDVNKKLFPVSITPKCEQKVQEDRPLTDDLRLGVTTDSEGVNFVYY
jgi:hypothetical protein